MSRLVAILDTFISRLQYLEEGSRLKLKKLWKNYLRFIEYQILLFRVKATPCLRKSSSSSFLVLISTFPTSLIGEPLRASFFQGHKKFRVGLSSLVVKFNASVSEASPSVDWSSLRVEFHAPPRTHTEATMFSSCFSSQGVILISISSKLTPLLTE